MVERRRELSQIRLNLDTIDKEVTMVLQSLQWERKQLLKGIDFVSCSNNPNHRMPGGVLKIHKANCILKSNGYSNNERLLPDVIDREAPSVVKLTNEEIQKIINVASAAEPQLHNAGACAWVPGCAPAQSLARLQHTFSPRARRAIHDAVVARAAPAAAPPPPDHHSPLSALPNAGGGAGGGESAGGGAGAGAGGGRAAELAAEAALRDTRRRRARYRGADTRNYSDTLRTLIHSQMEFCTDAPKPDLKPSKIELNMFNVVTETKNESSADASLDLNYPNNTIDYNEKYRDANRIKRTYDNDIKQSKRQKKKSDAVLDRKREKSHRSQNPPNKLHESRDEKHYDKKIYKYDRYSGSTRREGHDRDRFKFKESSSLSKDRNNYNVEIHHKSLKQEPREKKIPKEAKTKIIAKVMSLITLRKINIENLTINEISD